MLRSHQQNLWKTISLFNSDSILVILREQIDLNNIFYSGSNLLL